MKGPVVVTTAAIVGVAIIAVAGVACGYDGALLAGAMSSIAGLGGGAASYFATRRKLPEWYRIEREKEAQHNGRDVS